jgi:hypothetical protein
VVCLCGSSSFDQERWALQNKNKCPLRGSHDNRSRTRHVGDSRGQIDPCGWTESKHALHPLQCTHQALERIRIKIRMYLDPAPARQHYG